MTYYSTRQLEQVYFDSFSLQTLHWARAFGAMGDGLQGSETGLTIVFSVAPTQVLRPPHAQHVSSLLHAVVIVL